MSDIVNIKQAFHTLNRLKIKEVVLPYNEYHKLKDIVNLLHSNDGGSHNFQERFDEAIKLKDPSGWNEYFITRNDK